MKRYLILLCFSACCWAALPAGAQWEVRAGGGNDNNGGFFNTAGGSGTDYSQQNSPQYSIGSTATTSTTTVFVATGNFTSAMIHNGVHIYNGTCTAGWYEMVGFTSNHQITVDRSAGSGSNCAVAVGGALATIATALGQIVTSSGSTYNTVWVKSTGTYTQTSSLSWPASVTASIQGYNSTHGDLGTAPLITTATNTTPLLKLGASSRLALINVSLSNTASVRSTGISNNGGSNAVELIISNCTLDGFTSALSTGAAALATTYIVGTEIKNSSAAAILYASNNEYVGLVGVYCHDNTGACIDTTGGGTTTLAVSNSIFATNAGSGISVVSGDILQVVSSDFVGQTGAGILADTGQSIVVQNSIFYNNSTYGISVGVGAMYFGSRNNAYGSNGTAATNNFPAGTGDVTLSANPFTSSTNFALNKTAGGGAALRALGYPGAFPGGTTTGYLDIGAVQSQAGGSQVGYSFVQ